MYFFKSKGKMVAAFPGYMAKKKLVDILNKGFTGRVIVKSSMYVPPLLLEVEFLNGKPVCAKGMSGKEPIENDHAIDVFDNIVKNRISDYIYQLISLDEKTVMADCGMTHEEMREEKKPETDLIDKLLRIRVESRKPEVKVKKREKELESKPAVLEFESIDPVSIAVTLARAKFQRNVSGSIREVLDELKGDYYLSCTTPDGVNIRIVSKGGKTMATQARIPGDLRVDCKLFEI